MAWSADGRRLVVVSAKDERLDFAEVGASVGPLVDSGVKTGAANGCPDRSGTLNPCEIERIALSPDGRSAAFSQDCTGGISGCFNVAVVNLETGRLTVLEPTMSSMFYPIGSVTWSPDSKTIAFDRRRDARDRVEASDIYLIDADGANLRKLDVGDLSAVAPALSPDGAMIAFTSHTCCSIPDVYTVESDVYTVGLDGSHLQRITADGGATAPGWTGDGRIRFLRDPKTRDPFARAIPRLWLIDADGSDETELPEPVLPSGLTRVMPYGPDSGLLVQPDPR
jgi:TolB protein